MDVTTGGRTTVADIVRADVLGRFIHESIQWLDNAESEGREGLISDDRFEKGLQNVSFSFFFSALLLYSPPGSPIAPISVPVLNCNNQLCRFYNSLIKLGVVDPASDADSTEMAHFTLRNSRFEEANALYRALALVRF